MLDFIAVIREYYVRFPWPQQVRFTLDLAVTSDYGVRFSQLQKASIMLDFHDYNK